MLFSLYLIIDLYFLIPAVIVQVFNVIAEFRIHIRIPTNESNTEIETHPVIAETKLSDFSL